jgi:hypothetical protein
MNLLTQTIKSVTIELMGYKNEIIDIIELAMQQLNY